LKIYINSPFLLTKRHSLLRFIGLFLIIVAYFIYVSIKLGTKTGLFVTALTWSFFIFCTPIADAGFLVAFPTRILIGVRMMYTQIIAFFVAFFLDLFAFLTKPEIFNKTFLLKLFYQIITHPFPLWGIIILSLFGTLLSIYFGDELIDVAKHKERKKYHKHGKKLKLILTIFLVAGILVLYKFLLKFVGLKIPL
jgi:H+/Cl- antiporter ClcA